MTNASKVLLLDDGELDSIRVLLEEMKLPFIHLRGGAIEGNTAIPVQLLIATARRMLALQPIESPKPPVQIVIVNEDSPMLRQKLRGRGVDYLVREPIHIAAMRLLILSALYRGPERRQAIRFPFGSRVVYKTGANPQQAHLEDLSCRGCLLTTRNAEDKSKSIEIELPEQDFEDNPLQLAGQVVRCDSNGNEYTVAVSFNELDESQLERLNNLLSEKITTPRLRLVKNDIAESEERRSQKRSSYEETVFGMMTEAQRVLVGRDLSVGGMRISQTDGLKVGDLLSIGIYGAPREEPLLFCAQVLRDDGRDGLALRFVDMTPEAEAKLEGLVARLPSLESLQDGEANGMGAVVSEILDRPKPGKS